MPPLGIVQQHREPAGSGIETAEPRAVGAMQPFIVAGAGITEVRVVMLARIPPGMALGKDNVRINGGWSPRTGMASSRTHRAQSSAAAELQLVSWVHIVCWSLLSAGGS